MAKEILKVAAGVAVFMIIKNFLPASVKSYVS